MLSTGLKHLETNEDIKNVLENHENVMICCGRMGPMCTPVYSAMQSLEPHYSHVVFRDLDFDIAEADFIKSIPECALFRGLPFTVFFKNGNVAAATTSIQSQEQITEILNKAFC